MGQDLPHLPFIELPQPLGAGTVSVLRITRGPRGSGTGEGVVSLIDAQGKSAQIAVVEGTLDALIHSLTEMRDVLDRELAAANN